ncbi:MAG: BrnT family toxin [Candidatus Riflebacteria bacterium]|nr:BrnT family toxin [Candidatus Riflebacteria bacterium]
MDKRSDFEWDSEKDQLNQDKHGVAFSLAQFAFLDKNRVILEDFEHSDDEKRYYCLEMVACGVMTVRFTWRSSKIRIIGAGYWRKGKKIYEEKNCIHR